MPIASEIACGRLGSRTDRRDPALCRGIKIASLPFLALGTRDTFGIAASHSKVIQKVAYLHLAIQAFDKVIEEGWSDQPS